MNAERRLHTATSLASEQNLDSRRYVHGAASVTIGPNRTLAAISNAAAQPVIAAIRAERSILSAQTSVCGQSTILLRLTNDCYRSKF